MAWWWWWGGRSWWKKFCTGRGRKEVGGVSTVGCERGIGEGGSARNSLGKCFFFCHIVWWSWRDGACKPVSGCRWKINVPLTADVESFSFATSEVVWTSFHSMKLMCLRRRTFHSQWCTVLTDVWNDHVYHPLRPWLLVLHVCLQTFKQLLHNFIRRIFFNRYICLRSNFVRIFVH